MSSMTPSLGVMIDVAPSPELGPLMEANDPPLPPPRASVPATMHWLRTSAVFSMTPAPESDGKYSKRRPYYSGSLPPPPSSFNPRVPPGDCCCCTRSRRLAPHAGGHQRLPSMEWSRSRKPLREPTRQQSVKLTGTLATSSGCVQAKGRRASVPSTTSSWTELRLHRVFLDLAGSRNIASAGAALYLVLFKGDATRIGWLYPLESTSAVDVVAATKVYSWPTPMATSSASGRTRAPSSLMRRSWGFAATRRSAMGTRGSSTTGLLSTGLDRFRKTT